MRYELKGEIAQTAIVYLEPNEHCWITPGNLISLKGGIKWDIRVPGGLAGAVSRMVSGESIQLSYAYSESTSGLVKFGANFPGKLYPWDLRRGNLIATRGAFIGAIGDIEINVTVAKIGAAVFGGAGFILQKIKGDNIAFVHGLGDYVEYDLASGESLQVSTGNLAAFSESVDYSIKPVGGVMKSIFGKEGIFMANLTGPGKVLVQSMKYITQAE